MVTARITNWLASILALATTLVTLAVAGCVAPLPLAGASCPCAAGFRCCPLESICVPNDQACPTSGDCPVPPNAPEVFVLCAGSGDTGSPTFTDLDDDGVLPLYRGPQGGYHVYLQVRMDGLDPSRVQITRYLFDPADTVRDSTTALRYQVDQVVLACDTAAQDWLLAEEQLTYVCPSLVPGQVMEGRDLVLRLEATDAEGRTNAAEHVIHPVCPAGDAVCTGDSDIGCAAP